jgi:hypothetical protein
MLSLLTQWLEQSPAINKTKNDSAIYSWRENGKNFIHARIAMLFYTYNAFIQHRISLHRNSAIGVAASVPS